MITQIEISFQRSLHGERLYRTEARYIVTDVSEGETTTSKGNDLLTRSKPHRLSQNVRRLHDVINMFGLINIDAVCQAVEEHVIPEHRAVWTQNTWLGTSANAYLVNRTRKRSQVLAAANPAAQAKLIIQRKPDAVFPNVIAPPLSGRPGLPVNHKSSASPA